MSNRFLVLSALSLAASATLVAGGGLVGCNSPVVCEASDDCPVDRVCGDDNVCVVPQSEPDAEPSGEPSTPEPGGEPGTPEPGGEPSTPEPGGEPSTPEPGGEPSPPEPAGPPTFVMPDSATPLCEDVEGFPDDCPLEGEPGYGQDGNTTAPLTTYSFVNGGIQDDLNGLVWEENQSEDTLVRSLAVSRCENLETGGRQWRLPTVRELATLLDLGRDPTVDISIPAPPSGIFHTNSVAGALNEWYAINLDEAFVGGHAIGESGGSVEGYVKCVSGEDQGGADFIRVGTPAENVVMDITTGVMFQTISNPPAEWGDALAFCDELTLAGESDWRLTTAKDLILTLDPPEFTSNQALHPVFETSPRTIWSSSVVVGRQEILLDKLSGRFSRTGQPRTSFGFLCARGPSLD